MTTQATTNYDDNGINDEGIDNSTPDHHFSEKSVQTRLNNRLRRWHVTFGNPALGTYGGSIVTIHHRSQRRRRLLLSGLHHHTLNNDNCRAEGRGDNEFFEESSDDDESWQSSSDDSFSSCTSLESFFQADEQDLDSTFESKSCQNPRDTNSSTPASNSPASNTYAPTPSNPMARKQEQSATGLKSLKKIAVMANVPPHQVPDGVLHLVRGHRPFIRHVRIVIGSSPAEEAEQRRLRWVKRRLKSKEDGGNTIELRRKRSQTWACQNDNFEFNNVRNGDKASEPRGNSNHESLSSSGNISKEGRSPSIDAMAFYAAQTGYDKKNCDGSSEEFKMNELHCAGSAAEEDKNYHLLFVLDSQESTETFVSDLHGKPFTTLDESETCSVYRTIFVKGEDGVCLLGPFLASSSSASANHSIDGSTSPGGGGSGSSISHHAADEQQCPVCLEKMSLPSPSAGMVTVNASSSIMTTVCNHSFHIDCLLRWQDSPCPVCRYDHSGLNDTLSRCHACASVARNYVCLICGVISCASNSSSTTHATSQDGVRNNLSSHAPSHKGHAMQHYEETLHAYALDTETQHVWDFAGGGYVHRLLQNADDGKIVEGRDPRALPEFEHDGHQSMNGASSSLSALERSNTPTYSSSAEDDEAVHRKLEGIAGQYYTLLKSQLEQQRIYYEQKMEAIRREHENAINASDQKLKSTAELISALKQERNQLEQRCVTLRRKHKKVSDNSLFLKNMIESLEADKVDFRTQITQAQAGLAKAREMTVQSLAPLEEKLYSLMLQLDSDVIENESPQLDKKPSVRKK
ncbi:hypothetical protein ACHAXS_001975 [Conticribra weissflogii]